MLLELVLLARLVSGGDFPEGCVYGTGTNCPCPSPKTHWEVTNQACVPDDDTQSKDDES